jgi:2-methylisocitrate lyase-like PEP mutase family enzyme
MMDQIQKAEAFAALHRRGEPLVLINIWDVASAGAVVKAGAKALATSSVAVAQAQGFDDGETLPRELLMAIAARIAAAHDLPLTVDSEAGYGSGPQQVAETVDLLIAAGAVGMNIEDQVIGGSGLYDVSDQSSRIAGARRAADKAGVPFFINARTDIFLKLPRDQHTKEHVAAALQRGQVYAQAGASGFFVPGLTDPGLIAAACEGSALPVNIMGNAFTPSASEMARLGVARISLGPRPFRAMLKHVEAMAADYLRSGVLPPF